MQGAWIEIFTQIKVVTAMMSLPVQGAWIEILPSMSSCPGTWSLPVQGAWIEIAEQVVDRTVQIVAPRAGSVD